MTKSNQHQPTVKSLDYSLLRMKLFVRVGLNEDKKEAFACMIENDEKFPPIRVYANEDGTYTIEDGRHRIAAYEYFWREHKIAPPHMIDCEIVKREDDIDSFLAAIKANDPKGPLSMTRADKELQARQLMEKGLKDSKVVELLFGVYGSEARRIVLVARMNLDSFKKRKALEFMTERNLTPEAAAKAVGIKVEDLNKFINNKKTKGLRDPSMKAKKSLISSRYRALSQFSHLQLQQLFERCEKGEVTESYAAEILNFFTRKNGNQIEQIRRWRDRFGTMIAHRYSEPQVPAYTVVEGPTGIVMKPGKGD